MAHLDMPFPDAQIFNCKRGFSDLHGTSWNIEHQPDQHNQDPMLLGLGFWRSETKHPSLLPEHDGSSYAWGHFHVGSYSSPSAGQGAGIAFEGGGFHRRHRLEAAPEGILHPIHGSPHLTCTVNGFQGFT